MDMFVWSLSSRWIDGMRRALRQSDFVEHGAVDVCMYLTTSKEKISYVASLENIIVLESTRMERPRQLRSVESGGGQYGTVQYSTVGDSG